ncbi:ComF family protein [Ohtaekwangia sp.]|uniref:ComF family protein n=1 Tax=Ohtaekwangia sp. TaxID=2066019 RepID=UPI002FDDA363
MANSLIAEIFSDFVSLFFPSYCIACSDSLAKGENLVCTKCMLEIPQTNYHRDVENPLYTRLSNRFKLGRATALFKFSKTSRIQHLLHALKYKNQPDVGIMLGNVLGQRLSDVSDWNQSDLIIPVPLHPSRKRKRGYNQSAKFAEGLSRKLGIPFSDDVLIKKISTETQTKKNKLNRWQNVDEVFHVKNPLAVKNKRILLVDDVITTGATIEACAQALLRYGCCEVNVASIAEA